MKILLTGASGQLGQELLPRLGQLGSVTAVDLQAGEADHPDSMELDLGDFNLVEIVLNRLRPDVIVNAAGFTAVDQAEYDSYGAFHINAELPRRLARWSKSNGGFLLHYSTDYVFNGEADLPYTEQDETEPLNVYGDSKRAGEWALRASECRCVILRTSWVYSQ
jgi:dTDP-4-dehydrorhamnose reductase